eukprot:COSAG01_NODE_2045_length_8561_cov_6.449421_5_plen_163_part_00
MTWPELAEKWDSYEHIVAQAFDAAAREPKITDAESMVHMSSAPLAPVVMPGSPRTSGGASGRVDSVGRPAVMRKLMSQVLHESLADRPSAVYIGEDVEHGGYYLVSEGLARAFPGRCTDFPPDETALIGAVRPEPLCVLPPLPKPIGAASLPLPSVHAPQRC